MKVSAWLGKTRFDIEDGPTPNVVKITRNNSDGEVEFFVPRELVLSYVIQRVVDVLPAALVGLLR